MKKFGFSIWFVTITFDFGKVVKFFIKKQLQTENQGAEKSAPLFTLSVCGKDSQFYLIQKKWMRKSRKKEEVFGQIQAERRQA